jgi:hypothetical protein
MLAGYASACSRAEIFIHTRQPNLWNTLTMAQVLKDVDDIMSKRRCYERLRLLSGSGGIGSSIQSSNGDSS